MSTAPTATSDERPRTKRSVRVALFVLLVFLLVAGACVLRYRYVYKAWNPLETPGRIETNGRTYLNSGDGKDMTRAQLQTSFGMTDLRVTGHVSPLPFVALGGQDILLPGHDCSTLALVRTGADAFRVYSLSGAC